MGAAANRGAAAEDACCITRKALSEKVFKHHSGAAELLDEIVCCERQGGKSPSASFVPLRQVSAAAPYHDRNFVLKATAQNGHALAFAAEDFRMDVEIVTTAVTQCGEALQYASQELRGNRAMVTVAVSQSGPSLQYASLQLQSDEEIVKLAVAQNGSALEFASDALRADPEIVLLAESTYGRALEHAAEALLYDEEFMHRCQHTYIILKVAMLSGRSCIIAVDSRGGADDKQMVLDRCADKLGLNWSQRYGADLLLGTEPAPHLPIAKWPGLIPRQVNVLQLVSTTSTRAKP
mmetsp:Transcript_33383/g.74409  ORF Transcript_33383/g.74409 Transcript_33383/m.74409 type:complete len:293 (+) Transcript_33383:140-1018(+)